MYHLYMYILVILLSEVEQNFGLIKGNLKVCTVAKCLQMWGERQKNKS